MKILIIGNEGYIGPLVANHLRKSHSDLFMAGFDMGYFAHLPSTQDWFPERYIDVHYRGDVRQFPMDLLKGFDAVIYLAAISNDPMGKEFEEITFEVNWRSAVTIACKDPSDLGYVYGSCMVSEKTGKDIINWPCVISGSDDEQLLKNFEMINA